MKRLLALFALLLFASIARAQQGNAVIVAFPGAPSGTCSSVQIAVNVATGAFYDCLAGSWNTVSSAGGTVTSVSGTANQIDSTGGATPALSLDAAIILPGSLTVPAGSSLTVVPPTGDAGMDSFPGNVTLQTCPANSSCIMGPPSATPTGMSFQLPSAVPTTTDFLSCTTTSTNCLLTDSGITSASVVTLTGTQTLTNKTLTTPSLSAPSITAAMTGTGAYIPVTLLNGGTAASSSTFWRGDGTWATPSGSGTVNGAAQYDAPYYSAAGTATTLSGAAISGFQFDSTSGAPAAATASQAAALLQGLTGCNTATYILTPQASDCVAPGSVVTGNSVVNITPVTVAASVTTTQTLQELALPAGYLNSTTQPWHIRGGGYYQSAAVAPTLTFAVKLCTVSGCGSGTVVTVYSVATGTVGVSAVNAGWNTDLMLNTVTTGASGTVLAKGFSTVDLGTTGATADTVYNDTNTAASSSISLTGALYLDFTVTTSSASTSNSITEEASNISPQVASTAAGGLTPATFWQTGGFITGTTAVSTANHVLCSGVIVPLGGLSVGHIIPPIGVGAATSDVGLYSVSGTTATLEADLGSVTISTGSSTSYAFAGGTQTIAAGPTLYCFTSAVTTFAIIPTDTSPSWYNVHDFGALATAGALPGSITVSASNPGVGANAAFTLVP